MCMIDAEVYIDVRFPLWRHFLDGPRVVVDPDVLVEPLSGFGDSGPPDWPYED